MPNINPDQLRRAQIIELLREKDMIAAEIAEAINESHRMIVGALAAMRNDGIIISHRPERRTIWSLSPEYIRQTDTRLTPPIRRDFHHGVYTCPELRPFTGRPGAMDAYRLPSRGFRYTIKHQHCKGVST